MSAFKAAIHWNMRLTPAILFLGRYLPSSLTVSWGLTAKEISETVHGNKPVRAEAYDNLKVGM
jgi:hypothetical protein